MEDEKLAAYYDDLTRRGGGAARFKQGLGFTSNSSSANDDVPSRGSALPAATSFLSSFVKASSPSKTSEFEKQAELQSIQNKLSIKPKARNRSPSRDKIRDSRDRIRDKHSKRHSRSRDRHSRRRSRSRSRDRHSRHRHRSRSRSRKKNRQRSKRQGSPEERRSDKGKRREEVRGGGGIDFAKLIDGYDSMTPAERVKAKMKLQLSKTAENDETIGKGSGWERFEFNKDAPLDDEEIEAAEDDAVLVKNIGQSFRFSAVAARREEEMKALHDEAMFGVTSHPPPAGAETDREIEGVEHGKESVETDPAVNLLSNQVLTMKQGSWRDRACKR
ncbi:serine/arginine-rich splicing factor [Perilla frutescens var. hirtella]|uniref:Serine/arginine-rich splicing factor n=1 Tax=Perilla frutescens var. hirtella TaxID=608512 RepID=A0AAD4IQ13_PERFH|nr:serine/arginine-rich splicing factor [Perilla frutescens var. hirtella]